MAGIATHPSPVLKSRNVGQTATPSSCGQVGQRGADSGADLEVESLHEVPAAMPQYWSPAPSVDACAVPEVSANPDRRPMGIHVHA